MTRTARSSSTQKHKKMPEDATPWSEFSSQFQNNLSKTKMLNNSKKTKLPKDFDSFSFVKKATEENSEIFESSSNLQAKKLKNKFKKKKLENIKDAEMLNEKKHSNEILEAKKLKKILKHGDNEELDHKEKFDQVSEISNNLETKKLKKNKKGLKRKHTSDEGKNESEFIDSSAKKLNKIVGKKFDNSDQIDPTCIDHEVKNLKKKKSLKNLKGIQGLNQEKKLLKKNKLKILEDNASENELNDSENNNNIRSQNKILIKKNKFSNKTISSKIKDPVKIKRQKAIPLSSINLSAKQEYKLKKAKEILQRKRVPEKALKKFVKNWTRQAKLKLQKPLSKVCFSCRKVGHLLAECPLNPQKNSSICFKCGSSEHVSYKCYSNIKGYPFAKCFLCQKLGHIVRDCPKNTRGAYPDGGKCILCGSINHLKKECPTLTKKEQEEAEMPTLSLINEGTSVDAEDFS